MTEKTWVEAKIESIDSRMERQDELLEKLVDGFDRLTQHETRIDVIEVNQADHESRIRAIEKYKWVIVLVGAMFTVAASSLVNQSMDMIEEAKAHKPMTQSEYIKATKEAIQEAIKSTEPKPPIEN